MDSTDVAVATITWARSADEARILAASLQHLSALGLPTAVADRSDSDTMRDQLNRLNFAVAAPHESTLVAQVQTSVALAAAFCRPFILYTEPDKQDFFTCGVRDFLQLAPAGTDVGVILAGRSEESLHTFPPMQRYTEGVVNRLCGELFGRRGDYSYGPLLFSTALAPAIAAFDSRLGWGWRTALIHAAHRRGLDVLEVTGDFRCPGSQRKETADDRLHRLRQLSENVLGLVQ